MSFHGGFIGVMLAAWWFGKTQQQVVLPADGLRRADGADRPGCGADRQLHQRRIVGKATDVPWAMVFPISDPAQLARHPSQLYQFALEGVALFLILWIFSRKPRPTMAVSGMFALFYGIFRFIVEFVRVPDAQLGLPGLELADHGPGAVRADDPRRAVPDLAGASPRPGDSSGSGIKFQSRGDGLGFKDTGNS